MDKVRARIKELSRAVAEGRLALAEIAAVSPEELDAIYETAVMRLDVGRYADAARMLAALVVLYPFAHEYWRAYAIALKNLGEHAAHRRAQAMVRSLDPGVPEDVMREMLGGHSVDEATNPRIDNLPEVTAVNIELSAHTLVGRDPTTAETTEPRIMPEPFGGESTATQSLAGRPEVTVTAVAGVMVPVEPTDRITWPIEDEPTSLTRTPGVSTTPKPLARDRSVTALVDRRPRQLEPSDTARIDRRFRRRVTESIVPLDDNLTAIVRRRKGLPLGEDV